MGLRDNARPKATTPLIRANMSCCGSYHLLQSCFLSSSISMANLSRLVESGQVLFLVVFRFLLFHLILCLQSLKLCVL